MNWQRERWSVKVICMYIVYLRVVYSCIFIFVVTHACGCLVAFVNRQLNVCEIKSSSRNSTLVICCDRESTRFLADTPRLSWMLDAVS